MSGIVVVDASLAFKWLVREENSDHAQAISRSWANDGVQTAAPHLLPVEVANALHRRVLLGELTVEDAVRLLQHLLVLQRRFLDLVSFWAEIASQNARAQSCQACGLIAMRMCSRVLSCEPSL